MLPNLRVCYHPHFHNYNYKALSSTCSVCKYKAYNFQVSNFFNWPRDLSRLITSYVSNEVGESIYKYIPQITVNHIASRTDSLINKLASKIINQIGIFNYTDQNDKDKSNEQQHQNCRVYHTQPVNLKQVLGYFSYYIRNATLSQWTDKNSTNSRQFNKEQPHKCEELRKYNQPRASLSNRCY